MSFEVNDTVDIHGLTSAAGQKLNLSSLSFSSHATTSEDYEKALSEADLVVDFSVASALDWLFDALEAQPCALVSGTTGLSDQQTRRLQGLAQTMPILWASNMSLGVAVLKALVSQAARQLADWDLEIVETHHRHKLDAPSGTALTLAESAAAQRPGSTIVCGRAGEGRRHPGQIGVQAMRGGSVVGHHEVHFFGHAEQVTLSHRAESRDQFARGALRAAYWLSSREPGLYRLEQVLGL